MDLVVRLFASLRERAGRTELVLADLPATLDVEALVREIERRHPELGKLAHVSVVIGTNYAKPGSVLHTGDAVSLLPPVSGGAPSVDELLERGVFELVATALDPAAAQTRVADAACGAIAMFTGTTRSESRGKQVVRLDYEAFEAMTGPEMERIFARCRAAIGADGDPTRRLRMLCQHRVGTVLVGEPSVVIAVASPHRAAAFEACRFLIDALKQTLPIWKKEVYSDGHEWVGERS